MEIDRLLDILPRNFYSLMKVFQHSVFDLDVQSSIGSTDNPNKYCN